MAYPSSIDAPDTTMQGTTFVSIDDHALSHRVMGSAIPAIENKLGLGAGSASTTGQILVATGVGQTQWTQAWNNGTIGTPAITGGTVNNAVFGSPAVTGGTINAAVLGTPTIGTITVPGTVAALSFSAAIAPGVGTITDSAGGTLTVNAQQGQIFYSVMGTAAGNRTIGTPQNPTGYQQLTYAFKTSGSANGTLVWSSVFRLSQIVGTPTLGTGTSWNYFGWRYNTVDSKWDYLGQSTTIL